MLNLTFKDSGSNLDDVVSALIVEVEKLAGQPLARQAPADQPLDDARRPHLRKQRARQRDRRLGPRAKGQRPSHRPARGMREVHGEAAAMAAMESLAQELTRARQAAGFEVTQSSGSADTGEALSGAL